MLRRVNPAGLHVPARSYCHLVEETDTGTIWVAGQVGLDETGALAGTSMSAQIAQILSNYDRILALLALDRSCFVKRTALVTDMDEYFSPAVYDRVDEYFAPSPCAATLAGVSRLFRPNVCIEVDAVLQRPRT